MTPRLYRALGKSGLIFDRRLEMGRASSSLSFVDERRGEIGVSHEIAFRHGKGVTEKGGAVFPGVRPGRMLRGRQGDYHQESGGGHRLFSLGSTAPPGRKAPQVTATKGPMSVMYV